MFVASVTGFVAASPAADASSGPCSTVNGVTVVVDFGPLGGGVQVGCAPGDPDSGYAALTGAGFSVDPALRSPGFLCRIDGRPTEAADPCVVPSPPWAYWSYWIADRGRAWCYSDVGMLGRDPVRGTVEGWSFVSGSGAGAAHAPRSSTFSHIAGAGTTGSDCDKATTATTVPTTSPPRPPVTQRPAPGAPVSPKVADPGAQGGSPGTSAPATGSEAPAPPAGTQQVPAEGGAQSGPDAAAGATGANPGAPAGSTTTSTVPTDASTTTTGAPGGEEDSPAPADADRGGTRDEEALASVALDDGGAGGAGSALGTAMGAGTVTALAAAAVVVNRRRMRSPDGV